MSKKKEDLEAIVDLLHEWAVEYGEDYVTAAILHRASEGTAGMADISIDSSDYEEISIYRVYQEMSREKEPNGGNRTGSGT